jgi:hypothetical protein
MRSEAIAEITFNHIILLGFSFLACHLECATVNDDQTSVTVFVQSGLRDKTGRLQQQQQQQQQIRQWSSRHSFFPLINDLHFLQLQAIGANMTQTRLCLSSFSSQ